MLLAQAGLPAGASVCVLLMVQRLAPEKGTARALEALVELQRQAGRKAGQTLSLDGKRPLRMVIAGDGPSRDDLEAYAREHALPAARTRALSPLHNPSTCRGGRATLSAHAVLVRQALPVVFLGNLPNKELPPLYRH